MNEFSSITFAQALQKAENYCVYQERCHQEVRNKLLTMHVLPQNIDIIMVHLIDNDFLNETRFAISFARGKHRIKNWGTNRITRELKLRGVSDFNVNQAMREIDTDEYQNNFDSLAEKHWSQIKNLDKWSKRKKFCDFLLRKGFESNLIYEKLKTLEKE